MNRKAWHLMLFAGMPLALLAVVALRPRGQGPRPAAPPPPRHEAATDEEMRARFDDLVPLVDEHPAAALAELARLPLADAFALVAARFDGLDREAQLTVLDGLRDCPLRDAGRFLVELAPNFADDDELFTTVCMTAFLRDPQDADGTARALMAELAARGKDDAARSVLQLRSIANP